jgi:4-hydroxy-tetrahydrodipicolinate reductase
MNGLKKINIGIFGSSGRMGQELISQINKSQIHNLYYSYCYKSENNDLSKLCQSDVIIDFSTPKASLILLKEAIQHNTKIVCGTTGFTQIEFHNIIEASSIIPILYSANMSISINIIRSLIETLNAKLSNDFDVDIVDIHHKHKKDKPSGTALMLKQSISSRNANIVSIRAGEIPGTHEVLFTGTNEIITIKHQAFSRNIFASGAIRAAGFLFQCKNPAIYSMDDVLS